MYRAESCPCCGSTRNDAYPALVSPFVASYALASAPAPTRLLECKDCGFRYFEDRLTDDEVGRLYADYRGDGYYRERHRFEPWYTRKVNDAIGGDAAVLDARRATIERVLRPHVDLASLGRVLDYGGDRGQVIPASVGKEKFVYEISATVPVPGVTRIGTTAELAGQQFDAVLVCQVLEHLSDPGAVLEQVKPLLRTKDSVLYVEVPYERATLRWLGRGAAYRSYLDTLRRLPRILTAVDLYSTAMRVRMDTVPPLGFVKMHEHVNFFDASSLRALLERTGYEALVSETVEVPSPVGIGTVLVAVGRPRA
jgi:SAM-dependent methyltransferase